MQDGPAVSSCVFRLKIGFLFDKKSSVLVFSRSILLLVVLSFSIEA